MSKKEVSKIAEAPGREISVQDWEKEFWQEGNRHPIFHQTEVHPALKKYYHKLFKKDETGRVLLPLCGKAVEMIYFADLGHDVVGIEYSETAIAKFFEENNFTESISQKTPFKIHKVKEKNITIYQGDYFHSTPKVCGEFDAVWDRGSYGSINMIDRMKYSNVMYGILKPYSRYLMHVYNYDGFLFTGPPHYVTEKSVKETLGSKFSCELVESVSAPQRPVVKIQMPWWLSCVYFMRPLLKLRR